MATEKNSGLTSRGDLLTTELNSLANATYSAAGTEYDNTAQLDVWAIAQLTVTYGTNPTVNSPVHLWALGTLDGTNYEDGSASLRPPDDAFVGSFQLYNNTSAQKLFTRPFKLKPIKLKLIVYNLGGQTMAASGNKVTLYTFNRTIN